jgi:hypothetical protein
MAATEVRDAIEGNRVGGTPTVHRPASQRANAVLKGPEYATARYSPAQIAASNARMQQAIMALQRAVSLTNALGNDPAGHIADAVQFGNYAIQAANAGLTYVSSGR